MSDSIHDLLTAVRRNQILDAATVVFAQKGFHTATIRDVARAAGIADGTIYNYFANKTALLLGIFDRMRESIQPSAELAELVDGDVRAFLREYLRHPLVALQSDDFALFRVVLSEMMVSAELRALYQQHILTPTLAMAEVLFEGWAAQGRIRAANVPLALRAVAGMLLGMMVVHVMGDETVKQQWAALPDFLADLLLDGIRAE